MTKYVDIVFDGPPGPEGGRFVEVENDSGQSIRFGEWFQRPDGYWVIRFTPSSVAASGPLTPMTPDTEEG